MDFRNGNTAPDVAKELGPEEQAIVSNIASLIQELQGGASAAPGAEPSFGDDAAMNPGAPQIAKGSEQGRTGDEPQSAMQPGAAPAARGMAPKDEDDDVEKAFKVIAKALVQSESEGPVAQDKAEERVEDTDEDSEDNIAQVAKALRLKLLGKGVKKSRAVAPANDPGLLTVLKSIEARLNQHGAVLAEVLGGLGIDIEAPQATSQVANSQSAGAVHANSLEEIVAAVAMGMNAAMPVQGAANLSPVAKGFETRAVGQSSIDRFSELAAEDFGWGRRQ